MSNLREGFTVGNKVTVSKRGFEISEHGERFIGKPCTIESRFSISNPFEDNIAMAALSLEDGTCCCFRLDMLSHLELSWQEQISEEYNFTYVDKEDSFVQMGCTSSEDMVKLAKRILELSGE